jgi:hypothetical protein
MGCGVLTVTCTAAAGGQVFMQVDWLTKMFSKRCFFD